MGTNIRQTDTGGFELVKDDDSSIVLSANADGVVAMQDPGLPAIAILRIAANVADTETVTIGNDVYEFDTDSTITAGNIAVDVSGAVTPTAATDALVAAINASGSELITAYGPSNNEVVIFTDSPSAAVTALAETMAGSNNAWDTSALRAGAVATTRRFVAVSRVPNAQEVALGTLRVPVTFTPRVAVVQAKTTSSDALIALDGDINVDTTNNVVTLNNDGSVDFAATDTVTFLIWE